MKERFEEFVEQAEDTMDAAKSLLPKQAKVVQQTPNGKSVWVRFTGESADRPLTKVPIAINSPVGTTVWVFWLGGRKGMAIPVGASTASTISDIAGLQAALDNLQTGIDGKIGEIRHNGTVISAQTLRIQSRPGLRFEMHPTGSGQVDLWPEWGTGANEIARGNHTHAKSQNGLYAINNSGSGDVTKATWLDGIYGTIEGGIELTTSSWNANQLQILARWGTDANQVARGNHTHTINGTFTKTHTVNTTTTPRTQPGTSSYAQSTIASGTQVTMLMDSYGFVTSNGIDWAQIFEKGRGVCWVNSDHLTAI